MEPWNYLLTLSILFIVPNLVPALECGLPVGTCNKNETYRSIDGSCNNKKHPNWGTLNATYSRLLPAKYGDGSYSFPLTLDKQPLPNARNLTVYVYTHGLVDSCEEITLGAMTFGQALTHDLSFTLLPSKKISDNCCTPFFTHHSQDPPGCVNIEISPTDPFYSSINATCLPFYRTLTNRDIGCQIPSKYGDQINMVNSYVDLSIIYGNTIQRHTTLRSYTNGTLLVEVRNNNEWPPSAPKTNCPGLLNFETQCYRTGDGRFIQNPQLTITHILWIREHNRIARDLANLNPHWNDEKLFQVARSINIAEWQHIAFYELLPLYAGFENLVANKVLYKVRPDEYVNDYDENQSPQVYQEFAHASFRQFHSLITGKLGLYNSKRCPYDTLVLRDHVDRPVALEKADIFDGLVRGLALQSQMASDIFYDPDFTRGFFITSLKYGQDIRAVDVQRSRDHGLPSYNDVRQLCGLTKASNFSDFSQEIAKDKIDQLKMFYKNPNDIDLIVGGSMETNVKGTLAGPTFLCILYRQFRNTRRSDSFWYENKNSGLSRLQLREIRKATIAKLYCDNGNNIKHMQKRGFLRVSNRNPQYPCRAIQGPNLKYWKE